MLGRLLNGPMVWPATYSRRTVCPECHVRVRLEDVRFTPNFPCPQCGKEIRVSKTYKRALVWLPWVPGAMIPYLLGARSWWLLLCWIPCTWMIGFLWMYAGKYLFPPRLERYAPEPAPFQGLGLGPR